MADENEKNLNADDALRFLAGGGEIKDEAQVEGPPANQLLGEVHDTETIFDAGTSIEPETLIEASSFMPAGTAGDPNAYTPTRVRAISVNRQARHVHSHQYKRMMIPLLLVVGGLLLIMGVIILMIISMRNKAIDTNDFFSSYGWMFVGLAIPMGLLLLMGAWMFWKDLQAHEKRLRLSQQKRANSNPYGQPQQPPSPRPPQQRPPQNY